MTILTDNEVEKYRGLRIGSLEKIENLSKKTLKKLKLLEEKVIDSNSDYHGLPFYLAYEHHTGGKSVICLSQEIEVNQACLRVVFSYFNIPTLNRHEASKRLHSDPEFNKKNAEARRRNAEERRTHGDRIKEIYARKVVALDTLTSGNMNDTPMKKKDRKVDDRDMSRAYNKIRDVIRAYDKIILHTTGVKNWKELIPDVSKKTGAEPRFVKSCLEELFKIEKS